eukprot:9411610-Pyramimonas_sp.AAC.1
MERSELSLLPELGSRNYPYSPHHLEKCARSSALNSCWECATVLLVTEIDSDTSGASVRRIENSELGPLLELAPRNY